MARLQEIWAQRVKNAAYRVLLTFYLPIIALSLVSLPLHSYATLIVVKNRSLAFTVKFLMALLALLRLASAILRSFFAMCYHRKNCWYPVLQMGGSIYPTPTNAAVSALYQISNRWMVFLELGLSINRFFALFFDGRYYRTVQKTTIPLTIVTFVLTTSPFLIGIHAKKVKNANYKGTVIYGDYINMEHELSHPYETTEFQKNLLNGFEHLFFHISAVSIALDVLTFLCLKLSIRHQASNQKSSADLRLSIMAISTHIVQMLPTVLLQKARFAGFRWVLSHLVTIYNYHWHTVHAASQLFMSIIVIILMRPSAIKKKKAAVSAKNEG